MAKKIKDILETIKGLKLDKISNLELLDTLESMIKIERMVGTLRHKIQVELGRRCAEK